MHTDVKASSHREWFRRFVAAYLVGAPGLALLLIPVVPHPFIGLLLILHGLLLAPTFISNGSWFAPITRHLKTDRREVYLTLDDGPDPERTPRVLELLSKYHAKALFFVIGQRVSAYPELARLIVAQGHELGNHTHSHRQHWFWSYLWKDVRRELEGCSRAILEATGVRPRWFRSPVGITNPFVYPVARSLGLRMLGWSARARDAGSWPGGRALSPRRPRNDPETAEAAQAAEAAEAAAARVLAAVSPGAVIVIHPERTGIECLEKVLRQLQVEGYQCVLPD